MCTALFSCCLTWTGQAHQGRNNRRPRKHRVSHSLLESRKYFQRNALYSQIFSKGSRIDISAFSSECIDFFLRQQTYLSVPVTSMRITLDSLVRTQPCGIQRFFLRASFFADTDGCNCACLYCLFHHYPPICTICLFSVIFSLVSKQCICGFARITRCSSSRICS